MSLARYLANLLNSSGQVEAAKLAATLDLSSKTLTYPDNSVQSADIASLAASKLSGQVPDANAPSGSVIQVVQSTYSTEVSIGSAGSWNDIGVTANITPISTSNKILVTACIQGRVFINSGDNGASLRILRSGTEIFGPAGSNTYEFGYNNRTAYSATSEETYRIPLTYLDSPSSTSALTYKIQAIMRSGSGSNSISFQDDGQYPSVLVLMEIAA